MQPDMYDNKGTSLLLVHTEKGIQLLKELSGKSFCKAADLHAAAAYNPSLQNRPKCPSKELRKRFFSEMNRQDFEELVLGILEES